jgi:tetratricopeptide (TPR) repeat protein
MEKRKSVMISSTINDLPEHRKEVMDACLRQGMFPIMMEHLPASDDEAIRASLKMVDDADIYVGIFAHRYGYVPKSYDISVTEMEYNRAVERKIPRCIFVMDEEHPIKKTDVEMGEGAKKHETFKKRLLTDNIVNFFKSPTDLHAHVINSLSKYHEADITQFHYVSDIPQPPEAYIAHPYTLLQTHRLIGRQDELNLLTNWVTKRAEEIYYARILSIVAVGGMGKSALTWKWFNDIALQEMKPLAGRMWWSFYESDASFENFVIRALAYVTKQSREEVQKISPTERELQLLAALDREPFLIVLDGLERILLAYARIDAARLADDDIDQRTANYVVKTYGLPESAAQSFVSQHLLRKTADPRAGSLLRKLANVRAARILVSTRLYPADLQAATGEPMRGCFALFLPGLNDDDALNLWRAFNVSGSRETLLPMFHKFENHPLLMQSLASEVANYRRAPGDFKRWQHDHPNFNPFNLSLVNVRAHVLEFALRGLYPKSRKILETIAAFRMPASYDTLAALFVGEGKLFPTELALDVALKELEDRGLIGWDKRANRYDLHPIVRGVVWSGLPDKSRKVVLTSLNEHFELIPKIDNDKIDSLEDLTGAIELYNTFIGLKRYDDAYAVFDSRMSQPLLYRLSDTHWRILLLEMLFPDGTDKLPRLSEPKFQITTLNALAIAYQFMGSPHVAITFYLRHNFLCKKNSDQKHLCIGLRNLADAFRLSGSLYESQNSIKEALVIARKQKDRLQEAINIHWLGLTLAAYGEVNGAQAYLQESLKIFQKKHDPKWIGTTYDSLAEISLLQGNLEAALSYSDQSWQLAENSDLPINLIRASRRQGATRLEMDDLLIADERLHYALALARTVNFVEEEIQALIALAELRRRRHNPQVAREILADIWEPAKRGPYPLFHADALNVLVQIERDEGNNAKAVEAATEAYKLAWCNGEPYTYKLGLSTALKHLRELGASAPEMPPFDK